MVNLMNCVGLPAFFFNARGIVKKPVIGYPRCSSLTLSKGTARSSFNIPILDASELLPMCNRSKPAVLKGSWPNFNCEAWCNAMLEDLGETSVDFQVRRSDDGSTELFSSSLSDFLEGLQEESTHIESWYLLDEHILDLPHARTELRTGLDLPETLLLKDEFEYFPPEVRPQKLCLIVGGEGARSFLHSDPMEWTGWNLLLEGRKLWTFLPPEPSFNTELGTYRLPPNAFGAHNISAGWQSPIDLYRRREDGGEVKAQWPHETGGEAVMPRAVSFVQEAGDIVFIPPRFWHQVYHLEPSIAVASQFMDEYVRKNVFRHILEWTGACENDLCPGFSKLPVQEQVREVLRVAFVARYGSVKGLRTWSSLSWGHCL
ncbi:unnamed protein product [Choristocarpus tenellus]